jgi:A/G-specific adenine glycosylase
LIAELMLHRTRADLVEPYFRRFLRRYPDPAALAAADSDEVVELLRPLGFLHRSRRLRDLGTALLERHGGEVPTDRAALLQLPGVGPYIANAVLVVCFGHRLPLLDPNVIRVITRVFDYRTERARPRDDPALWDFVADLVPPREGLEFGLGLVDLGALICRPRRPRCPQCPLRDRCHAYRNKLVKPAGAHGARG